MNLDAPADDNLHSPQRRLIELRIEHADLDSLIDRAAEQSPLDELVLRGEVSVANLSLKQAPQKGDERLRAHPEAVAGAMAERARVLREQAIPKLRNRRFATK